MATYIKQQRFIIFWRCFVTTFFFIFLIGCQPQLDTFRDGVFYQPLNQDKSITPLQWRGISSALQEENIYSVVIQWTSYGEDTFGGPKGWLASNLVTLMYSGEKIWLGLYSDPNYFQAIHTDVNSQKKYLTAYFEKLYNQYQLWSPWLNQHQSSILGLYLPLEISDYDFSTSEKRKQLKLILADQVSRYPHPLMVSLYLSGNLSPSEIKDWTKQLREIGLIIYVQDGAGTGALSLATRTAYNDQLSCTTGEIREIFKQDKNLVNFTASKLSLKEYTQIRSKQNCRQVMLFSLRYLPINNNPLLLVK